MENSNSSTEMFLRVRTFAWRARRISPPVESPGARRIWLWLYEASVSNTSLVPCRSNCLPQAINSSMRSGPSSTRVFTASGRHMPSPAISVSCRCRMTSSSSLSAGVAPPGADWVPELLASFFASTNTRPAPASSIAARKPATPAPITMKSVSAGRPFINGQIVPLPRPVRSKLQRP